MNDRKTNTNGRTLRRLLRGSWRYFAACIAASLLFTACELVIPQIIRVSVDSLIGNAPVKVAAAKPIVAALGGVDRLLRDLWIPAALMAGFGLLSAIMRYCVNLYSSKAGETLVKTSRDLLYHHIQHLPMLTGYAYHRFDSVPLFQFLDQRAHFYCLRAGAEHQHNGFHL